MKRYRVRINRQTERKQFGHQWAFIEVEAVSGSAAQELALAVAKCTEVDWGEEPSCFNPFDSFSFRPDGIVGHSVEEVKQ